jgi:hypothetical protein
MVPPSSEGGSMRLFAYVLTAFLGVTLSAAAAPALMPVTPSGAPDQLVLDAKIICGDTGDGYKCRTEPGALRRGKMRPIPTSPSDKSSGGWFGGSSSDDSDALPPAPGDTSGTQAAPATCPSNTEMLAGHCIPYTQTCNRGLAANANPQACRAAEEKQVCSFRADGLKDCCCRIYSKF